MFTKEQLEQIKPPKQSYSLSYFNVGAAFIIIGTFMVLTSVIPENFLGQNWIRHVLTDIFNQHYYQDKQPVCQFDTGNFFLERNKISSKSKKKDIYHFSLISRKITIMQISLFFFSFEKKSLQVSDLIFESNSCLFFKKCFKVMEFHTAEW